MTKYPYIVNKNGVWYPAWTEVPVGAETLKNITDDKEMNTKENQYTKTDINRMPTSELKRLGTQIGIDNAAEMSGADLKLELIKKMGL